MGFIGSLFGGGGGGSSGGGGTTSTTTTIQELSPEQKELLGLVIPEAKKIIAEPPKLFPTSTIAPQDPLQLAAQERALAVGAPGGPAETFAGAATDASQFLFGPVLFPESNPALAAATEAAIRPLTQSFERTILPGIRHEAITAGGFGGSRQGIAEANASEALLRQIGDVTSTIQANAFQQSLDAMVKSLFAAPATQELALQPSSIQEAVGIQRRADEQTRLSEEANRFLSEQLIPFATAQDVAALAFGIPGGKVTSTASLPPPRTGSGGGVFSDILSIGSTILPFFL